MKSAAGWRYRIFEPTSRTPRFDDVIMQNEPGPPVNPEHSLVACSAPYCGADADADGMRQAAANAAASTRTFMISSSVLRVSTRGLVRVTRAFSVAARAPRVYSLFRESLRGA